MFYCMPPFYVAQAYLYMKKHTQHLAFKYVVYLFIFLNYIQWDKEIKQLFCLAITGFKWSDVPLNG